MCMHLNWRAGCLFALVLEQKLLDCVLKLGRAVAFMFGATGLHMRQVPARQYKRSRLKCIDLGDVCTRVDDIAALHNRILKLLPKLASLLQ